VVSSERDIFTACAYRLLLPVVRFCLGRSLRLKEVLVLVKKAYLEAAEEEILRAGEQVSESRLSAMTGVHRHDVKKLRGEGEPLSSGPSLATRIVGHWQSDERFTTKAGRPRVLSAEGVGSEFFALVQSVSKTLNPYTVLFEFQRGGIVEKTKNGIKLVTRSYLPVEDVKESFKVVASDAGDLIQAAEENVFQSPTTANLHLRTEFDHISNKDAKTIRKWLLREGSAFHRKVHRYLAKYDRDVNSSDDVSGSRMRVAVGSFSRVSEFGTIDE
jgi:hypothetical protein